MKPSLITILLAALALSGCVGTMVKDLSQDQATLRIRISNALYGQVEIDRSNVQGGSATTTKDGMIVDTSGKIPSIPPKTTELDGSVIVTPGLTVAPMMK